MNGFDSFFQANTPIFLLLYVWSIFWKGYALWKGAKQKHPMWFATLLVLNTIGFFEIAYIFIFSKIKDIEQFKKIHDTLLIIAAMACILLLWNPVFSVVVAIAMSLFAISVLEIVAERKKWKWLVFGILLAPIIPTVYYFLRIRNHSL